MISIPAVWLLITNADFFLSLHYLLVQGARNRGTAWRLSSYLNRTARAWCTPPAVIGNRFHHAPIFQKQHNPTLWPRSQGFPPQQHERLGPGRTGRKISLRHSFCRRKLTQENAADWTFNCTLGSIKCMALVRPVRWVPLENALWVLQAESHATLNTRNSPWNSVSWN